jgi:hypothetical protein
VPVFFKGLNVWKDNVFAMVVLGFLVFFLPSVHRVKNSKPKEVF